MELYGRPRRPVLAEGMTRAPQAPESPRPYVLVTLLNVGSYYRSLFSRHLTMIDRTISHYRIVEKLNREPKTVDCGEGGGVRQT
jgi:hypothetical protein